MTRVGAVLLCVLCCACEGAPPSPDVLLITVDTLRADHLSSYGFPLPTSPNVDRLAREGVVFERAVAAASATTPSHASIMTSLNTREHTVGYQNGKTKLTGATTLAERFREAGYATAAFVGNVMLRRELGLDAGFDVYDDELPSAEPNRPSVFERTAEQTTERALAWLARAEAPFFLWVHYQDPHGPYTAPPPYRGRFASETDRSEPPLPRLRSNWGIGGLPFYQQLEGVERASEYRARYAEEILYADASIGVLLDTIARRRPVRPRVVLLTADHGEYLGENDRYFLHGVTSLPPEAHVPLVLRADGIDPERRGGVVGHVDVMPTLLELAGLDPTERVSGLALGPYLRGGRALPQRLVYCDAGFELSAYAADTFIRVRPAEDAWLRGGAPRERSFTRHAWTAGPVGEGEAVAEAEKDRLRGYLDGAVPMVGAAPLEPEEFERARALGYID